MSLHAPLSSLPLFGGRSDADQARTILKRAERESRRWLDSLRNAMRQLYDERVIAQGAEAFVTADDARRLMRKRTWLQPPAGVSMNAMGALFRAKGWTKLPGGKHNSRTPGSHGNDLDRWAWVGEE